MSKIYLGIDQSYTSSGYCLFKDDEMFDCGLIKTDKKLDIFQRSWNIAHELQRICMHNNVESVGIEGLAFGIRGSATRDLAGLQFTIINKLQIDNGLPVKIIAPLTLKKFATGDGRAKKEQLFEQVPTHIIEQFQELGAKKTTGLFDLVDSYFIGKYIIEEDNPKNVDKKTVKKG